jgi:hypothetical protein
MNDMKYATALSLPFSATLAAILPTVLAAQAQQPKPAVPQAAEQKKDVSEQEQVRKAFEQVLNTVSETWFGSPYLQTKAMEINGTLVLAIKGGALDAKIEQIAKVPVKGAGVASGQAQMTLKGTYFANGDHHYEVEGDLGRLSFQRQGDKGYWCIKDEGIYTMSIDSMPKDAPTTYMGWFASLMSDIKEVYVKGSTFKASWGKDAAVQGKTARTVVFHAPTAAYDPKKREQAASDTFSFWKKGHMEVAYEESTKRPLRMEYSNAAQGVEATMSFVYDAAGKIKQIDISNRSKQWEGPGHISATYGDGRLSRVSGELTGSTHKIIFNIETKWSSDKNAASIMVPPPNGERKGREEMELRFAMRFAGNIGALQRSGFNVMAPKVTPIAASVPPPARLRAE